QTVGGEDAAPGVSGPRRAHAPDDDLRDRQEDQREDREREERDGHEDAPGEGRAAAPRDRSPDRPGDGAARELPPEGISGTRELVPARLPAAHDPSCPASTMG